MSVNPTGEKPNDKPTSEKPAGEQPGRLLRFQFTIARLLACTVFVALAAWVWTLKLPITLTTSSLADRDILPYVAVSLLLATAVGSLLEGKRGAVDGVRIGCGLILFAILILVPLGIALTDLAQFLARYF
jgi:hypothetical protein